MSADNFQLINKKRMNLFATYRRNTHNPKIAIKNIMINYRAGDTAQW